MSILNYTVIVTDCIPPLYHLTGCLIYSPAGNTLRPSLLGCTLSLQGSPSHQALQVRPRPYGLGQTWYNASSPWPRPPWRLAGRLTSSTTGSAPELRSASLQDLQDLRARSRKAIMPERRLASPAELYRAAAKAREEGRPWNRASPLQDDLSAYLQT